MIWVHLRKVILEAIRGGFIRPDPKDIKMANPEVFNNFLMREAVGIFDSLHRAGHLISSDPLMDQREIFNLHREQAEHINNRRQADPEPINNLRRRLHQAA